MLCLPHQSGSSPKVELSFLVNYTSGTKEEVQKCTRSIVQVMHTNPVIMQINFCMEEVQDAVRTNEKDSLI